MGCGPRLCPQMEGGTSRLAKTCSNWHSGCWSVSRRDSKPARCVWTSVNEVLRVVSVKMRRGRRRVQGGIRDEMCSPGSFCTRGLQFRHTVNQQFMEARFLMESRLRMRMGSKRKSRTVARRTKFRHWNRKIIIERSNNWRAQSC